MDSVEIDQLIETGRKLSANYASQCLYHDDVHTHGGCSPTRSNADSEICWSVSLVEKGHYQQIAYLPKNSPLWTESEWGKRIIAMVQPHLTEAPWRLRINERGS